MDAAHVVENSRMSIPISLQELSKLDVDLDSLVPREKSSSKRGLTGFEHLALRGRRSYAESLSSVDSSDARSFSSQQSSSSRPSSVVSDASTRSERGRSLVLLGLSSAEIIAVKTNRKKSVSNEAHASKTKIKQYMKNSFFSSLENGDDTTSDILFRQSNDPSRFIDLGKSKPTYPPLAESDVLKLLEAIDGLNKTSSKSIRTLLDCYSEKTQHFLLRNAKKANYMCTKQSLLGIKKSKARKSEVTPAQPILIGEWINKHVFSPKSVHLHEGGAELFLYVFRSLLGQNTKLLKKIRQEGYASFRQTLLAHRQGGESVKFPFPEYLDGLTHEKAQEELLKHLNKVAKHRGKKQKDRILSGSRLGAKTNPKLQRSLPSTQNMKKEKWKQVVNEEGHAQYVSTLNGQVLYTSNHSSSKKDYVDENGDCFYTNDRFAMVKHSKTNEEGNNLQLANPYKREEWEPFLDATGVMMYANVKTGEVVPELRTAGEEQAGDKYQLDAPPDPIVSHDVPVLKKKQSFAKKIGSFFTRFSTPRSAPFSNKISHFPQRKKSSSGEDVFDSIA
jgi:hypothetical protein